MKWQSVTLKFDVEQTAAYDRWLRMADAEVEPEPTAPASTPEASVANGEAHASDRECDRSDFLYQAE